MLRLIYLIINMMFFLLLNLLSTKKLWIFQRQCCGGLRAWGRNRRDQFSICGWSLREWIFSFPKLDHRIYNRRSCHYCFSHYVCLLYQKMQLYEEIFLQIWCRNWNSYSTLWRLTLFNSVKKGIPNDFLRRIMEIHREFDALCY